MPNIKQIAKLADVSIGTVSNVLNNLPTVKEATRARVMEAIELLGYQPSLLGRALRKDRTNMIGMIVPDIANPFFPSLVRGAEDVAFRNEFRLVLCNSDNDFQKEEAYLRELRTYLPAGLIITTTDRMESPQSVEAYRRSGAGVVYADRIPSTWDGDAVASTNDVGAYEATKYLIELGHKHIAMLSGPLNRTNSSERMNGFVKAMKEARLPVSLEHIQETTFDTAGGAKKAALLLQLKPRPTAIFAADDLLAFGALLAARSAGLTCPDDLSVFGFDNLDICEVTTPTLSSVDQRAYEIGARAAQILIDRVGGDTSAPQRIYLQTTLKLRDSIGPPPVEKTRRTKTSRKR